MWSLKKLSSETLVTSVRIPTASSIRTIRSPTVRSGSEPGPDGRTKRRLSALPSLPRAWFAPGTAAGAAVPRGA